MFIFLCLVCPRPVDPLQCTSEKGEESSGRKASCPDSSSRQRRVWQESRLPVKPIRRNREPPLPIRQTQPAFHPHAQRNSFSLSRCASAIQIVHRLAGNDCAPRQPAIFTLDIWTRFYLTSPCYDNEKLRVRYETLLWLVTSSSSNSLSDCLAVDAMIGRQKIGSPILGKTKCPCRGTGHCC
jgi:hypothetical protein